MDRARKYGVPLFNDRVEPWKYDTRISYLDALKDFFEAECERPRAKPRYWVNKQVKLGEELERASHSKRPKYFSLQAALYADSQFENCRLANQDTIEGRGGLIVHGSGPKKVSVDSSGVAYLLGFAVYYPDRWSPVYATWKQFGRELLERIDDTIFVPELGSDDEAPKADEETYTIGEGTDSEGLVVRNVSGDSEHEEALDEHEARRQIAQEMQVLADRVKSPLTIRDREEARPVLARYVLAKHTGDKLAIDAAATAVEALEHRLSTKGLVLEGSLGVTQQAAADVRAHGLRAHHSRLPVRSSPPLWRLRIEQEALDEPSIAMLLDSGWTWE